MFVTPRTIFLSRVAQQTTTKTDCVTPKLVVYLFASIVTNFKYQ